MAEQKPIIIKDELVESLISDSSRLRYVRQHPIDEMLGGVFNLDAAEFLARLPDNSVDVVLTDEPYGVALDNNIIVDGRADVVRSFEWDSRYPAHLLTPWVFEASRVLAEGGALINCGSPAWTTTFENICALAGLMLRGTIQWFKTNPPTRFRHGGWRSATEVIWIASKGSLNQRMRQEVKQHELKTYELEMICPYCDQHSTAVISGNYSEHDWNGAHLEPLNPVSQRLGHPTEKPPWIPRKYLWLLSIRDDIIVDPFCGSGIFVDVAAQMGRRWIANDLDPGWANATRRRMQQVQIGLKEVFT